MNDHGQILMRRSAVEQFRITEGNSVLTPRIVSTVFSSFSPLAKDFSSFKVFLDFKLCIQVFFSTFLSLLLSLGFINPSQSLFVQKHQDGFHGKQGV